MKLPTLPGLEIALSVDKRDLEEHDDSEAEGEDGHNVRYVEAVSGANFAVEFRTDGRFKYRYDDLEMRLYLDGAWAQGNVFNANARHGGHPPGTITGKMEKRNGLYLLRKFAFADLKTDDGQPKDELKEKLARLGEVTAKLYRVRNVGEIEEQEASTSRDSLDFDSVPEKALKGRAISSRTILGKAEPTRYSKCVRVTYPWGRDPFATFTFKYRSHHDLQIEGIIPRSPSPVPLEERDPDTLTAEEARELVRIQRQQLQNRVKVKKEKREREEDEVSDDGEVTMMGEQRKGQRTSTDSGIEVIDLSNETDEDDY